MVSYSPTCVIALLVVGFGAGSILITHRRHGGRQKWVQAPSLLIIKLGKYLPFQSLSFLMCEMERGRESATKGCVRIT